MGKCSLLAALGILALLAVARAMPQAGSDSSSQMPIESRELMDEMTWIPKTMDELLENDEISDDDHVTSPYQSSDVVLDDETESMIAAEMCVKTAVDLDSFLSDIDMLSNETRTAFFSQYCPQLERTALCMDDLLKAARPNFEEDVFIIVKALAGNYPDLVDLICKNDGEMIFKLADPTTKECVVKLWDHVMVHIFPYAVAPKLISLMTETECKTFSQLTKYIEAKLNVCNVPDLMSVYDLFHNTMFSVTTCRNYVVTATEAGLLAEEVAHAKPQPDSNSSPEESTRESMEKSTGTSTFMGEIRTMCRKTTGSDDAYIALTEAIETAIVCVITSVDVKNFISDVDTISNETRATLFPRYCPQLKRAGSCLDDLLKAARPCLEEDAFTNILAVAGMYPDTVDLICKNDGEIIFTLAEPKTKECISELMDNVRECTVPFDAKIKNWDISHLMPTQMAAFSELRQGIEGKLNVCEAPGLINVYGVFHNTVFRLDSCYNVRPFLEQTFVPFVQYMSTVAEL